jgi:hypothetical protein
MSHNNKTLMNLKYPHHLKGCYLGKENSGTEAISTQTRPVPWFAAKDP